MNERSNYQILLEFIDAINTKNLEAIDAFLPEKHIRISQNQRWTAKAPALEYWENLLRDSPNYKITITSFAQINDEIAFLGIINGCMKSTGDEAECHILVKAKIENGKFSKWNQLIEDWR